MTPAVRVAAGSRWTWAIVVVAACLPYVNSLDNGFHYDDEHSLVRNPHLRQLRAIPEFFHDSGTFSAEPNMAMYRPLLQTTFALNYAFGGYEPAGWRIVNILLHALAAAGAYAVLRQLVGAPAALAGGVLFALHPIHTQAVNYISSRSEVLCMAGVLWALYLGGLRGRPGWGTAAYVAALLSKSAAVALVPLLTVLEWRRPREQRRWGRLAPFAIVTIGYVVLIHLEGFLPRSLAQEVRPWGEQLLTQTKVLVYYLRLACFPVGLSVEHDFVVAPSPWSPEVLVAAAAIGSLTGLAIRARRQASGLGWLWFVGGLAVPFVVPLNVIVNEHRLYLPTAGLILAIVAPLRLGAPGFTPPRLLCGAVGICLAVLTLGANTLWHNDLSLWSSAVERAPHSHRAWSSLGLALHSEGRFAPAAQAYRRALEIHPGHARAWNNLGLLQEEQGSIAAAMAAYRRAADLAPVFSGPLANLGRLYLTLDDLPAADATLGEALARNENDIEALVHSGRLAHRRGDTETAQELYGRALDLDPDAAAAANNLGLLLVEMGRTDEGRAWLRQALIADPQHEEASLNLALLELETAGVSRLEAYRRLMDEFPRRGELVRSLGDLYGRAGNWPEAVRVYQAALERGTTVPRLRVALGDALLASGRAIDALRQYRIARREEPPDGRLLRGLAAAAAAAGQLDEALEAARQALELDPDDRRAAANLRRLEAAGGNPAKER